MKLTTYSKTNLKLLGVAKVSLRNPRNKKKYRVEFAVIDEDYTPLLGSSAAQQMQLITVQKENILQVSESIAHNSYQELDMKKITASYHDVFTGLGCMEGTLHLEVDKSYSAFNHASSSCAPHPKRKAEVGANPPRESQCDKERRSTDRL